MKTSLEDISSVKKKLIIEIESKEVDKRINKAYRELGMRAKIPGFRPGKVPRKILERRFSDDVAEDVTRELINESFPNAIAEVDTMPLGTPLLEKETLKQSQNFKYSAVIEVRPQFELKDYLGLEVEKEKYSITDKDVKDRIEQIRQSNGNMNSIEPARAVQEEDYVALDYEAFEGETPLNDVKANNFFIKVGSNDFHPQFEKELIGLKKDDETEINVDFEESHYNSKLAGKSVKFKVKIIDIKEMVLPELNDEFAKNLGADFNTLEDLRTKMQEMISSQENNRIDKEMKDRLLNKITESVDFETPQVLIESELDYAVENFKQSLTRSGSSFEQSGIKEEKLRSDFRPASEKRVKEMLILEHIAKTDKITVGEEELGAAYDDLAANMGMDAKIVRQYYETRDLVDSLKEKLIAEKTLNYLVESAKVFEVECDALNQNKSSEKENN